MVGTGRRRPVGRTHLFSRAAMRRGSMLRRSHPARATQPTVVTPSSQTQRALLPVVRPVMLCAVSQSQGERSGAWSRSHLCRVRTRPRSDAPEQRSSGAPLSHAPVQRWAPRSALGLLRPALGLLYSGAFFRPGNNFFRKCGRFRQDWRSHPKGLALTGADARLSSPCLAGKVLCAASEAAARL